MATTRERWATEKRIADAPKPGRRKRLDGKQEAVAFSPAEARRILSKLEFHHTPKHASWLNMVEIELSVLVHQCLKRRIPDIATLTGEVAAWELARNSQRATIRWQFDVSQARNKLSRLYL